MTWAARLVTIALLVSPWPLGSWYPGPRTLIYLLVVFAAYLLLRPGIESTAARLDFYGPDLWVALPLVMALSLSWSVAPADSYEQALFWSAAALLYACISRLRDDGVVVRLVRVLTLLGGALAVYTLYQYWCSPSSFPAARMSGPFTYPNSYGAYLLALASVTLGLAAGAAGRWYALGLVCASSLVASIVYTGSRGALLAVPLALAVFLWLAPDRRRAARCLVLSVLGGALIFVALLLLQPAGRGLPVSAHARSLSLAGERVITVGGSASWAGRLQFWRSGVRAFLASPWVGLGARSYHQVATAYQLTPELFASYLHNDYLQFLAELGLVGGGAVVAALAGTVQGVRRLGHRARARVGAPGEGATGTRRGVSPVMTCAGVGAGSAAGVSAILAHSLVDLDLQFPAVVLLLFTLLGVMVRVAPSAAVVYRASVPTVLRRWLPRALPTLLPLLLLVAVVLGVRPYGALVARQRTQDALEEGNLPLALRRAGVAWAVMPGHPRTAMLLAHILREMEAGESGARDRTYWRARAVGAALAGARINPYDPYLQDLAGSLYLEAGNVPAALAHLGRAVTLFRWEPRIRLHLALAYEAAGQKRQAVEELAFLLSHRSQFQKAVGAPAAELEAVFREAARLLVLLTGPPGGYGP
ncbi:MAG: O-antigen ligase family protein [Bacillota bacterium]